MSGKPTLFRKGSLTAFPGQEHLQAELDKWVPIDYIINWIRTRQQKTGIASRVCILKSETASGKSTAVPGELFAQVTRGTRDNIIITQPRVLTAVRNILEMLPHYKMFKLGENIGWSTGFNKLKPRSYGLLSATIGTLYMQLSTWTDEEIMRKYHYILIDETHERNMQIDMTIYMLKNLLKRNATKPECPFVFLMSATFDPDSFLRYFDLTYDNAIWCKGASYGFDEMWEWNENRSVNNYPRATADVVERIVRAAPTETICDVIVFLPGKGEMGEVDRWLRKTNAALVKDKLAPVSVLQLDANSERQNTRDYQLVDIPLNKHKIRVDNEYHIPGRRVILSTNVAETGLTLPEIKYVIDAGYNKQTEYNPNYGIKALITKPASQSNIKQRKGRAGRKFKGVFYPLYPRYIYDMLQEFQYPQILYEDLSAIILDIFNEQERSGSAISLDMDMIDKPPHDSINRAMEIATALGFVAVAERITITGMGRIALEMINIPLEIRRMLLAGWTYRVSIVDLITIAAGLMCDIKNLTIKGEQINWLAVYNAGAPAFLKGDKLLLKMRLLITSDFIDYIFLMNAIKSTQGASFAQNVTALQELCTACKIQYDGILEFIGKRDELIEQLLSCDFDIFSQEEYALNNATGEEFTDMICRLKYCIYEGFRLNIATLIDGKYYAGNMELMMPAILMDFGANRTLMQQHGITRLLPERIMYSELGVKHNKKNNMYGVRAPRVCAIDGWVQPDDGYTL